jgi:hypothetical protein
MEELSFDACCLHLPLMLLLCCCRPDFMTNFVDNLVDWAAVAKRFEAATH